MKNENYYDTGQKLPLAMRILRIYYQNFGSFFPGLSTWLFWKLFSTPKRREIKEKHKNFLKTANSEILNIENHDIQTYTWGNSAKKVLIVHGWEGISADFKEIITTLTDNGFKVMSIDLPAHGNSSGKFTHLPMLINVVQKLVNGHGPFYGIVSHSLGALASAFALSRINGNTKLDKLILMGLHPVPFAFFEQFRQALKIKDNLFDKCVLYVENKVDVKIKEASVHKIAPLISANNVLLVHDEKDEVANINNVKKLNQEWNKSELFSGHHGGHFKHYKNPEVVEKVVQFMKD